MFLCLSSGLCGENTKTPSLLPARDWSIITVLQIMANNFGCKYEVKMIICSEHLFRGQLIRQVSYSRSLKQCVRQSLDTYHQGRRCGKNIELENELCHWVLAWYWTSHSTSVQFSWHAFLFNAAMSLLKLSPLLGIPASLLPKTHLVLYCLVFMFIIYFNYCIL